MKTFKSQTLALAERAQNDTAKVFAAIEKTALENTGRVMEAFANNRVSEAHFAPTYGYGYGDTGRDTLDRVYAEVFEAEDALVRHTFINGTHTIASALFGILRPGNVLASLTGDPYDTLRGVIGMDGQKNGSLRDFGVDYVQLEPGGRDYFARLEKMFSECRPAAALIQRSGGYSLRAALSIDEIGDIIAAVKRISPDTVIVVDNCYGEFTETREPTAVRADVICGSLIKNPGGGLAGTGGYVAGKVAPIELIAHRATVPGIGREAGCSMDFKRLAFQGFFVAPHVVSQAIKTAVFAARLMELARFKSAPGYAARRSDIIQRIIFGDREKLLGFVKGIQAGSPVDSFVTPEPWDMPGYDDPVVMAAGAFVQGASIELSADAPMREPFLAYVQGGLTYESGRLGIMRALDSII